MAVRSMTVTFRRVGRGCTWTALRPPRTKVPGPTMAAGGDLPHDLYTFVIERALDLRHGFWGCVAAGATFKTLGRKRTPQGKAVIMRHLGELDAAETQVNEIEKRLKNDERAVDEREGDARVFAIAVRTMQDLSALDADAAMSAPQQTTAPASGDNDPVPRDIDEFRRRLAEKIDKLAAADAAEGAGRSET